MLFDYTVKKSKVKAKVTKSTNRCLSACVVRPYSSAMENHRKFKYVVCVRHHQST